MTPTSDQAALDALHRMYEPSSCKESSESNKDHSPVFLSAGDMSVDFNKIVDNANEETQEFSPQKGDRFEISREAQCELSEPTESVGGDQTGFGTSIKTLEGVDGSSKDTSLRKDVIRKTLVRSLKRYFAALFTDQNPDFKRLSLKAKKRKIESLVTKFIDAEFPFQNRRKSFKAEAVALLTMMISPSVFRKSIIFRSYLGLFDSF